MSVTSGYESLFYIILAKIYKKTDNSYNAQPISFISLCINIITGYLLMNTLYNVILLFVKGILNIIYHLPFLFSREGKFGKFVAGQHSILKQIEEQMVVGAEDKREVVWLHAASLGEYGVLRPIIKQLKKDNKYRIVVTFFSSTGYEALKNVHPNIDNVFYLPLDTKGNVRHFLDIVNPRRAVFIISEYWVNYLNELGKRGIPTFLVSAVIRRKAPFFKWYGGIYRRAIKTFTHFFVLDEESASNLESLGLKNYSVTGNPLFDSVITISGTPYSNNIVERFSKEKEIFMAGSVSDANDVELVCSLANRHTDTGFIIVPHEIRESDINAIREKLDVRAMCYSQCDENTDFSGVNVLIVDYLGELAYMYRYAKWAYVGGGFTPYLHNLIEAVVYGVPVSFGPQIHRKITPNEIIKLELGSIVRTPQELDDWFCGVKNNNGYLVQVKDVAQRYMEKNKGAALKIVDKLICGS